MFLAALDAALDAACLAVPALDGAVVRLRAKPLATPGAASGASARPPTAHRAWTRAARRATAAAAPAGR